MRRSILIVLDGVGAGEAPDAADYDDIGSNTLAHVSQSNSSLKLPTLQQLGLGNIIPLQHVPPATAPAAAWGLLEAQSAGKDSITGHWELTGVIVKDPFPTYPNGFPAELIERFEHEIGRKVLGNKVASGTEIMKELGEEHLESGFPLVYTSADSVFQIAAHEETISVAQLYTMCETARKILIPPHHLSRVIARPFTGKPGNFVRTHRRKDFSLEPIGPTLLDRAKEKNLSVIGIGKTGDLFQERGFTQSIKTENDHDGLKKTIHAVANANFSILFTNLVDFDSKYGHRNDPEGFARNLELFDRHLLTLLKSLQPEDLLFITADHGCDPTRLNSTDHTRERVPLLVVGKPIKHRLELGIRKSFADAGQTIAEYLQLSTLEHGTSFLRELI